MVVDYEKTRKLSKNEKEEEFKIDYSNRRFKQIIHGSKERINSLMNILHIFTKKYKEQIRYDTIMEENINIFKLCDGDDNNSMDNNIDNKIANLASNSFKNNFKLNF